MRLLETIEDNFLIQVLDRPTKGEVLLDLLLTHMDELIKDVGTGDSLGSSDHPLSEFTILRYMGQMKIRLRTLNCRRGNFQLLKELVDGPPGKLPSVTKELNRTGNTLRTFFL